MSKASLITYLRTHRKRSNLSQEEIAFLLDAVSSTVARHEGSRRKPSLQDAFMYEALFGVPASALFPGDYENACRQIEARALALLGKLSRAPESPAKRQKVLFLESVVKRVRS